MKKQILIAIAAIGGMLTVQAQQYFTTPKFTDNWSIGMSAGVMTPLKNHAFFGDMRGGFAFHIQKQLSPVFALGVESSFGINTASWMKENPIVGNAIAGNSTAAIDNFYVGAYGSVNLFNLFGGYKCQPRFFDIEAQAGAGWGYDNALSENFFATKAGLNFNFNCSKNFTLSLRPSVSFNMTGTSYAPLNVGQTSAAYSREKATFNFMVGFTYNWGPGFIYVNPKNQSDIDALNATINDLRGELDAQQAILAATNEEAQALTRALKICKEAKPKKVIVQKEVNTLQSIRYIFYSNGSAKITFDQKPNVEMVAKYLMNHKNAKVAIKGYASPDGNEEFNKKLAAARAESVKAMLMEEYGIAADRITAQGEGIGNMFSENDWNRVSICTLED